MASGTSVGSRFPRHLGFLSNKQGAVRMTDRAKAPTDCHTDRFHVPKAAVCGLSLLLLMTTVMCPSTKTQATVGGPFRVYKGNDEVFVSAMSETQEAGLGKQTWLVMRIVQRRWYHRLASFFKRTRDVQIDRSLPVEGFEVVRMRCPALVGARGRGGFDKITANLANCHQQASASCRKKGLPQISQYTYEVDERFVHRLRRWKIERQNSGNYEVWEERSSRAAFFYFCQKKSDLDDRRDACLGGSGIEFQPALQDQYLRVSARDPMVAAVSSAFNSSAASNHEVSLRLAGKLKYNDSILLTVRETRMNVRVPTPAQVEPSNEMLPRLEGWPGDGQILRAGTEIFVRGPFLSDSKAFAPPQKRKEATNILVIKIKKQRRGRSDRMKKRRLSKAKQIITLQCYSGSDQDRLRSCIDKLGDDKWADETFVASRDYDFLVAHMDAFSSSQSESRELDQYKYVIHGDLSDLTDSDRRKFAALHAPFAPSLWSSYREQTAKKMLVMLDVEDEGIEYFHCNKLTLRFSRNVWGFEAFRGDVKKLLPNVGSWVLMRLCQVDPVIRFEDKEETQMMVRADDVDHLKIKRNEVEGNETLDYRRATNVIIGGCSELSSFNITLEAFNKLEVWVTKYDRVQLRSTKIFEDPEELQLMNNDLPFLLEESGLGGDGCVNAPSSSMLDVTKC